MLGRPPRFSTCHRGQVRRMDAPTGPASILFVIVGTARSGTTLAQRLACELPGVRVPHETHFFNRYAGELLARASFPLEGAALREEIEQFLAVDTSHGLPLEPDELVERLEGRADSALHLFAGIVAALARDGDVLGEKTPEHLLWWEPLTAALDRLRVVGVVRDPRAVVASQRHVDWGIGSHLLLATQWSLDQQELLRAREQLGSERFLLLRYEDVVEDPSAARASLASFLGVEADQGRRAAPAGVPPADRIMLPWEHWKRRTLGPITADRRDAWRAEVPPAEDEQIRVICASEMEQLGYDGGGGGRQSTMQALPDPQGREEIVALHERRMAGIRALSARSDWYMGGLPKLPVAETPYGHHEWG